MSGSNVDSTDKERRKLAQVETESDWLGSGRGADGPDEKTYRVEDMQR